MSFKLINLLLCFNSLKATTIEKLLIILSSIGIILSIVGIIFIPWKVTKSSMEILYIIGLIFLVLSLVIILIIFYLRFRHKLRRRILRTIIITNIIMVFICFISLIIFIILSFFTISDLNNKETTTIYEMIEPTGEIKNTTIIVNDLTTKNKKIFTTIDMVLIMLIIIILVLLWISEYIRLIYNTELSYKEYVKREKDRVLKHPIQHGLNVLGHDKYGFPIFGKHREGKFIIKGVKTTLEADEKKIVEKPTMGNYFDENGKINMRYYAKYSQKPSEKVNIEESFSEKEKYLEKYFDNYINFDNKTILNYEDNNNSINPGYLS